MWHIFSLVYHLENLIQYEFSLTEQDVWDIRPLKEAVRLKINVK